MDAKLKARWVTALRSGEYRQGYFSLRTNLGSYCCLGVLCDLVDPNGWDDNLYVSPNDPDDFSGHLIPATLAEALGLMWDQEANQNGYLDIVDRDGVRVSLANLNDSGELTFSQIADMIENKL